MSNISFSKLMSIKQCPPEQVYDIQTLKNHNFAANGIVVHNCMIFQEQVMLLANKVAGFPLKETDEVRRAIMKLSISTGEEMKKKALELEKKFIAGCVGNGVPEETAKTAYKNILGFCGYAFNACLTHDTLVETYRVDESGTPDASTSKSIRNIEPGDIIRSRDEATGRDVYVPVVALHNNGVKLVVIVTLTIQDSNRFRATSVKCTLDHKFRTYSTGEMLPLRDILDRNLTIAASLGRYPLEATVVCAIPLCDTPVYDLEVDHPDHQFYLTNGLLTSNSHAVAYAIDSYWCAWLLTYYPEHWLLTYLTIMSTSPEKKAKAFGEISKLGYTIAHLDVNHAGAGWRALSGKRFMPSLLSCKGLGDAAAEELVAGQPYSSLDEMLYNEDGTWKPSKFNKRALEVLIKVGAFDSLGCVGDGKLFSSYKHMYEVMIENSDLVKKSSKRDPSLGKKTMYELARTLGPVQEWTRRELVEMRVDVLGSFDMNVLLDPDVIKKLNDRSVISIDEMVGGDEDDDERLDKAICWFCIQDSVIKRSKNDKAYATLSVLGPIGKPTRLNVWGWKSETPPEQYSMCVAEVQRDSYGFSTGAWKLRVIG